MKLSIAGRILLGVVLTQVISAAMIFAWFFYTIRAELNDLTSLNAQETVLRSVEATERYFQPGGATVEATRRLIASDVLSRDRPDRIARYFFEQLRLRPQLAGVYVGYRDGGFVYVMRSDRESPGGTRTKIITAGSQGRTVDLVWRDPDYRTVKAEQDPDDDYDPRARPWYAAAADKTGVVWTRPYVFFTSRKPGITASAAVTGMDGTVEAVVGVDMEMDAVSRYLRQTAFGRGKAAFVVTADGEVVAHSSPDLVLSAPGTDDGTLRLRKITELDAVDGAVREAVAARSGEVASAKAPIVWKQETAQGDAFVALGRMRGDDWPWRVVTVVPETGLMEAGRGSNLLLAAVILLATALAAAIGYALGQSIGRPLTTLRANANLARRGNVELMEEVRSGYGAIDEIDDALHELGKVRRRHGAAPEAEPADQK